MNIIVEKATRLIKYVTSADVQVLPERILIGDGTEISDLNESNAELITGVEIAADTPGDTKLYLNGEISDR